MNLHIYDFDGVIADSSHRYRLGDDGNIDLPHWIENEKYALKDVALPLLHQLRQQSFNPNNIVIIATARIWCDLSRQWARIHNTNPDHVISRRDRTDERGGAELKIEGIKNLEILEHMNEVHVYEDNKSYLDKMCAALSAIPHFVKSNQGH